MSKSKRRKPSRAPVSVSTGSVSRKEGVVRPQNRKSRFWIWLNSAVVVAIIGGVIAVFGPYFLDRTRGHSGPAGPDLEVDGVTVSDGSPATLTIELRNIGNQVAIIKSVALQIQQRAVMPLCGAQGYLPNTATYGVTIPADAMPGQTISHNVYQDEAPDAADRFTVTVRLPSSIQNQIRVYQLKVTMQYNIERKPLDAHSVLVAMPIDPDENSVWTKQDAETRLIGSTSPDLIPGVSKCLVANSQAIRPMLASPAARSASLSGLSSTIAYCCALHSRNANGSL